MVATLRVIAYKSFQRNVQDRNEIGAAGLCKKWQADYLAIYWTEKGTKEAR
jgi:hypothetical protein